MTKDGNESTTLATVNKEQDKGPYLQTHAGTKNNLDLLLILKKFLISHKGRPVISIMK